MNAVITSLQSSAAERIGWMLIHSLWQLALLAGVYLVVRQLLQRRSAACAIWPPVPSCPAWCWRCH